jgi:Fe-S-cluster containining protein
MAKRKKNKFGSDRVKRLSFPDDEKKRPWLKLLLDAYQIVNRGVARAIESEQKKGRKPACGKGCSNCCSTHKDIPIYPLEIAGISWYVTEKIKGSVRESLKKQLHNFRRTDPCPFLIEGACSIHPMRPVACRQFNVFNKPCEEGEDPYYARREDVMDPVKKYVDQAFIIMLPFYGVEKESERIRIVKTGAFHKMVKEMHACSWKELAEKMERYDKSAKVQKSKSTKG